MKSIKPVCAICRSPLGGRQRRFCSRTCKNRDTNNRLQNYDAQLLRGLNRKKEAIHAAGGCCAICGYSRNIAALAWHHIDPSMKRFSLDMRAFSNRRRDELASELKQCRLLCANCHAEIHHPELAMS